MSNLRSYGDSYVTSSGKNASDRSSKPRVSLPDVAAGMSQPKWLEVTVGVAPLTVTSSSLFGGFVLPDPTNMGSAGRGSSERALQPLATPPRVPRCQEAGRGPVTRGPLHQEGADGAVTSHSQAPPSAVTEAADNGQMRQRWPAKGPVTWAYTAQVTRVWVTLPVRPLDKQRPGPKVRQTQSAQGRRGRGRPAGPGAFPSTQRCSQRSWEPAL